MELYPIEELKQILKGAEIRNDGTVNRNFIPRLGAKDFKFVYSVTNYTKNNKIPSNSLQERCYQLYNNIVEPPKCKNCNKFHYFHGFNKGYNPEFCSKICRNTHRPTIQKWIDKQKKLYGGGGQHPSSKRGLLISNEKQKKEGWKERTEKSKKSNLDKYGNENFFKTDTYLIKTKITNLEKYGYDHWMKNPKLKENLYKNNLKKYGSEIRGGSCSYRRHQSGLLYQGTYELWFIEEWLKNNDISSIKRGPRLPYTLNKKKHIYLVDFEVKEEKGLRLIELKGKYRTNVKIDEEVFVLKLKTLLKYSIKNNYLPPKIYYGNQLFVILEKYKDIPKVKKLILESFK